MHSRDRTRARVKLHKDYNTWGWEIEGWALYDANGDILQHLLYFIVLQLLCEWYRCPVQEVTSCHM